MKIKAKPGYNLLIKDMGLSLRATSEDWVEVDEEAFNNSVDAKKIKNLILIDDGKPAVIETKKEEVKAETAFVRPGSFPTNPADVFVKDPDEDEIKKEEPKKEEIKIEVAKVEEPKVEIPKVEETKPEEVKVEEVKVEETKTEEVKVETPTPEVKAPKAKKVKSVSENA